MANDLATNSIHPAIEDHYRGMNDALHERDDLTREVNLLRSERTSNATTIQFLKDQVESITRQRDYYMRLSFALSTRINAMQDILSSTMELAKDEADNPSPKMPAATNIEQSQ